MYAGGQRLHTLGTAAPGQLDSPAASLLRICTIRSSHPRVAALGCTHGPSPSPAAQQHQGPHGPHTAMILWSDTWGLLWGLHQASQWRGSLRPALVTQESYWGWFSLFISLVWRVGEKGVEFGPVLQG